MRAKKTVIQQRGRLQLSQFEYTIDSKRKCMYVVSYGASKIDNRYFTYIGRDLYVTDKIQSAIDNLMARENV